MRLKSLNMGNLQFTPVVLCCYSKMKKNFYHRLIVRPAIKSNKQIELQFNEILISQNETFGVRSCCLYINNITICRKSSVSQLSKESCVLRKVELPIVNIWEEKRKYGFPNQLHQCYFYTGSERITERYLPDTAF